MRRLFDLGNSRRCTDASTQQSCIVLGKRDTAASTPSARVQSSRSRRRAGSLARHLQQNTGVAARHRSLSEWPFPPGAAMARGRTWPQPFCGLVARCPREGNKPSDARTDERTFIVANARDPLLKPGRHLRLKWPYCFLLRRPGLRRKIPTSPLPAYGVSYNSFGPSPLCP